MSNIEVYANLVNGNKHPVLDNKKNCKEQSTQLTNVSLISQVKIIMNKVLIAVVLATFILPSTTVMADYGDALKKMEERKLQGNHENLPLQPAGTSPAPTFDPSGTPHNSKSPDVDLNNKSDNNRQNPGSTK